VDRNGEEDEASGPNLLTTAHDFDTLVGAHVGDSFPGELMDGGGRSSGLLLALPYQKPPKSTTHPNRFAICFWRFNARICRMRLV
jgi:hypothetical protein